MTWPAPPWIFGSLRRFLLLCLLGGLALVATGLCVWRVVQVGGALARAQDEALVDVLAAVRAGSADVGATFRISTLEGERVAGDGALPACPWPRALQSGAAPDFYLAVQRGRLMRVAAVRHSGPLASSDATELVVQAALPWAARWPRWGQLLDAALQAQLLVLAAAAALAWATAQAAGVWMRRLSRGWVDGRFDGEPRGGAATPAELSPLLDSARDAVRGNRAWVEQQRAFLADASHQLRTPLAVLRAQLQGLQDARHPAAGELPAMIQTVDRATFVANQLLGVQRLDQMRRQGTPAAPVALWTVCRDAAIELAPLVVAKRLDFGLDAFDIQVQGDATLLGEMVRNLLANAIHHAPVGGRLGVLLRTGGGRRELIVWDEGPGIDDALGSRLFHPYAAGAGGTGLGLSICRQIAEASGASIALFNRVENGQVIGVDAVVSWGQGP